MFMKMKKKLKKLIGKGLTINDLIVFFKDCYRFLNLCMIVKEIVILLSSLIGFYFFWSQNELL